MLMPSPTTVLLRTQTDERLAALAREGHERAFEAIVERYRRPLLRAARRVLPESRAEDALQHALIAAWKGLQRGDEVRELRPWLYRIVHNTALNQLRTSGYDYDELQESLRVADGPDDELERRAVVRQTLAGLAHLPDRQREALLRIAVEGRSQEEVARDLGLSHGAVRQLVHRARTTLRTAATAVMPLPLVTWVTSAAARSEPMTHRIGELTAGAGGAGTAAVLAKTGAVVVLAGGAVGGPAIVERQRDQASVPKAHSSRPHPARAARAAVTPVATIAAAELVQTHRTARHAEHPAAAKPVRHRETGGAGGSSGPQRQGTSREGDDGERGEEPRRRREDSGERDDRRSRRVSGGDDAPERDDGSGPGHGTSGGEPDDDGHVESRTPSSGDDAPEEMPGEPAAPADPLAEAPDGESLLPGDDGER
jgi:RNA polymerase sigma factor (sigma-70 family)